MTVAVAGAATTGSKAQLLTLAILCSTLADDDASIRGAAAELVESELLSITCTGIVPVDRVRMWLNAVMGSSVRQHCLLMLPNGGLSPGRSHQ